MIFNYLSLKSGQRSSMLWSLVIALVFTLAISTITLAQSPHCHADELLAEYMISHNAQHEIKQYKNSLTHQSSSRSGGSLVELPVIFHIIHRGEAIGQGSNLTDAKIMEQLHILNTDFAFQNADKNQIPAQFKGTDTEIQFCLAKVNENGQTTSGIVRYELNTINSVSDIENTIKPQTQWDPGKYINIWIVRMPDPAILGYAYLPIPSILGTKRDGIVISHLKIGNQSTSTRGRTLVHEMGHYLGLLHMWGFDENDCDEDDQISDTPAAFAPYFGCPFHPQFSCGTADMFMNFMDYVNDNCMFLFTDGQKDIMQGILNNQRLSLKSNTDAICGASVSTAEDVALNQSFDLYPNPCTDHINVEISPDYELVSYHIYDLKGRSIQQIDNLNGYNDIIHIPTYNLQIGAYVVRFETKSGKSVVKRFVKYND